MPSEYLNRALRAGAMIPSIGIAPTVFVPPHRLRLTKASCSVRR
jgi:hypothetical protein